MNKKIVLLVASILVAVVVFTNGAPLVSAQSISTTCTNSTTTTTINGYVGLNGNSSVSVWFDWGATTSLGSTTNHQTFTADSNFSQQIYGLTENTTYYYRAMGSDDQGIQTGEIKSFRTTCSNLVPTVNISANPSSVAYNGSSILTWTSTNASSCVANGGSNGWTGSKNISGSFSTGALMSSTTYSISCTNASGQQAVDSTVVTVSSQPIQTCTDYNATNYGGVLPCRYPVQTCTDYSAINYGGTLPCRYNNQSQTPTVNLTVDDYSISSGDRTIVRWTSNNATSCTANGGSNGWSGNKSLSGSFNTGNLTTDKTYNITCTNNNGQQAYDSVTVSVDDNSNISVRLRADDTEVDYGDSTIVRWTSDNADTCRATGGTNGWSGRKNDSGSFNTGDLTSTTTFRITCENSNGDDDSDSITIDVNRNNNTCQDTSALNYRGTSPCRYNQVVNNQPTVVLSADNSSLAYNGTTVIRWYTTNVNSCFASGGSVGWAGNKSIGPGSFFTGSMTSSRTFTMTCTNNTGSAGDSVTVNVRPQTVYNPSGPKPIPSSYVSITSSVDRTQPILPTIDNSRPEPGDEINYTVAYQNIGTGSISNLNLRLDLPYEVDYINSDPSNPSMMGNTLIFKLGSLKANGEGRVSVRVRVRENIPSGTNLNFPAVLTYTDPTGYTQSVSANVSAEVFKRQDLNQNQNEVNVDNQKVQLGGNVFGAGFLPTNLFGWLLLIILILILLLLVRYLIAPTRRETYHTETTTHH